MGIRTAPHRRFEHRNARAIGTGGLRFPPERAAILQGGGEVLEGDCPQGLPVGLDDGEQFGW